MNFTVLPGQLRLALGLCYAGMAAGFVYDLLFLLRKVKGVRQAADVLFGLTAGGMYFAALLYCREERLRLPGLLFFLLGYGLHSVGLRRGIRFCVGRILGRKKADVRRNETG